ncbi:MAG: hypothetical protein C5B43_00280, partial [Verrucomicrobia bacterium]
EKANLNPIKLFIDIENQEKLVSLWISRVETIVGCITALRMLNKMSPPLVISLYFTSLVLPRLLVINLIYTMSVNGTMMLFEKPMHYFFKKMNHLKDKLIRQITNVDVNAELISFLKGEEFELKKLFQLLEDERKNALKYDFLNSIRKSIEIFIEHFEWLVPILAAIKLIRSGEMNQEVVGPILDNFIRISRCLTWAKRNFQDIEKLEESARRSKLYEEPLSKWQEMRISINKKLINSEKIFFSGTLYADNEKKNNLAEGIFELPKNSITLFDAPSGSGKTTLFRVFCGLSNNLKGWCSLPKNKTVYLPSQPYILGPDEPLLQTIFYPQKFNPGQDVTDEITKENIEFVKEILKELNLPERVYNELISIPNSSNNGVNTLNVANWLTSLSDGERKRVVFANIFLKLKRQSIKFLVMDEPFKGIDLQTQIIIVNRLKNTIHKKKSKSAGCTILYSNHESNHELNTHILKIDPKTKKFQLEEAI